MVKVEIVSEKDSSSNSPYASSSSSVASASSDSLSSVDSHPDSPSDESLYDRVLALRDIIPPTTRHSIYTKARTTMGVLKITGKVVGNIVWVVTTSALLVGLPLAVSLEDEAKVVQQEKEMMEQQAGQAMLSGGVPGAPGSPAGMYAPGSGSGQGKPLVPPGF